MTAYQQQRFSVAAGQRKPEDCAHGWRNPRTGDCVFCGVPEDADAAQLRATLNAMVASGHLPLRPLRDDDYVFFANEHSAPPTETSE